MIPDSASRQQTADPRCLFCKIVSGEVNTKLEHQDETCLAFQDINPQAPLHLLVIPRSHIEGIARCTQDDRALLGHLLEIAARLAELHGVDGSGYRVVINSGRDGGQTVSHLHLHLLGGRSLSWPPG